MKTRWLPVAVSFVLGLILLGLGLLIPAHLRALDAGVVLSAGRSGDSVLQRGRALADSGRLGAAEMFVTAARTADMPGWDRLGDAITNRARQNPAEVYWGNDTRLQAVFSQDNNPDEPFSAFIVQEKNREAALARLTASDSLTAQGLLRCRSLEHTVLIPASASPAGQAFDALVAECGLLADGNYLSRGLGGFIRDQADFALHGGGSQSLEQAMMDIGSLGERLNWDQLTALVGTVPNATVLHELADEASVAGERLPLLFVSVQLSNDPDAVTQYLARFPETGWQDLSASLWYGGNGVQALTERHQRLYQSAALRWLAARSPFSQIYYFAAARALEYPWLTLAAKFLCYLGAGFCFAAALHVSRPPVADLELPLEVRGFHVLREFLFSLGFLLVVLLLSEPFLAQGGQEGGFSFRLHLPMAGGAGAAGIAGLKLNLMNPTIILTLVVFFVLQALIYVTCLVKLAEIRRQQVPPRMKLKLLENEDHLFDAGLYLGFVGTIVSLIVASLGLVKFSLMAAYSSTSFGIIFVVIFKIFHLRPARRKLLMEAELADMAAAGPVTVVEPAPAMSS